MATFIIDHYDSTYETQHIEEFCIELIKMFKSETVIKNIKMKKSSNDKYEVYYPYITGKNYLIDSKLKSQFPNIQINKKDGVLFFFKLINEKYGGDVGCDMKISDILPKGVEITQYTIQYYYLLDNTQEILYIDDFIDSCTVYLD